MEPADTISIGGVFLVILVVYLLIVCLTTTVTGSLWLGKTLNIPLKDSYNIVIYSTGSNPGAVQKYIIDNPLNTLTADSVNKALLQAPTIIFKSVTPSKANEIINGLKKAGAIADAI